MCGDHLKKNLWQLVWDFCGIPFRFILFDQVWLSRFGWVTLEDERLSLILPHVKGRLLDIGCGTNTLVRRYRYGVGIDLYDHGGGALIVDNSAQLPFATRSFDTVTFVACFNLIPYRTQVLSEAMRLLRPGGQLLITMINPIVGGIGYSTWWYVQDKVPFGRKTGVVRGLWTAEVVGLCKRAGFQLREHRRFLYNLNNFYRFEVGEVQEAMQNNGK